MLNGRRLCVQETRCQRRKCWTLVDGSEQDRWYKMFVNIPSSSLCRLKADELRQVGNKELQPFQTSQQVIQNTIAAISK